MKSALGALLRAIPATVATSLARRSGKTSRPPLPASNPAPDGVAVEEHRRSPGLRLAVLATAAMGILGTPTLLLADDAASSNPGMVVAIVTYTFPEPVSLKDVSRAAARGAQKYLNLPGLIRKNYFLSEDGLRAGGIYVWESRARAEGFYNAEWRQAVTKQYGVAPEIAYLRSPVMVDNTAGRIVTDTE
jgi:hypothetical protein